MKNTILGGVLLALLIGAGYWFYQQSSAPAEPEERELAEGEAGSDASAPTSPEEAVPTPANGSESSEGYVGLSEEDAAALAESQGELFRVVERDGDMLPTTRDYRPGRINATVADGVVTSYTVEGEEKGETPAGAGEEDAAVESEDTPGDEDAPTDSEEAAGAHDAIIGMSEADAEAYAQEQNVPFRVGSRDGEALPLTMDYRPGRITADMEDGVVTGYTVE